MTKTNEQIENEIQEDYPFLRAMLAEGALVEEIDVPDETEKLGYPADLIVY